MKKPRLWPLLLLLLTSSCVDFGVDGEKFVCRAKAECGTDQKCVRGPGCYCVCVGTSESANATCEDPECLTDSTGTGGQ